MDLLIEMFTNNKLSININVNSFSSNIQSIILEKGFHPKYLYYIKAYTKSYFCYSTPEEQKKYVMYYLNQLTKIQGNSILNNPEKDHFEMNLKFEEKNQYPFVIHKAKLEQKEIRSLPYQLQEKCIFSKNTWL